MYLNSIELLQNANCKPDLGKKCRVVSPDNVTKLGLPAKIGFELC